MSTLNQIKIGDEIYDLEDKKAREDMPTKTSELDNDSGFITEEDIPDSVGDGILVDSVIGYDGEEIPEGYEEVSDINEIINISEDGIILENGFSKGAGFQLYKQGKRIFGYLSIDKSENFSITNVDVKIGTVKYPPKIAFYTPVSTGQNFWDIGVMGYLAIEHTSNIYVKVAEVTQKNIKGYIDYVIK